MATKETPTELFKRALAQSTRALAGEEELEVVFGAEGPKLAGSLRRLHEIATKMTAQPFRRAWPAH